MRTLRRLICWFRGHDVPYDETAAHCRRCGRFCCWEDDYPKGVWASLRDRLLFWWHYRRPTWMRAEYYRGCPDCGKRFNRHDQDCPPF